MVMRDEDDSSYRDFVAARMPHLRRIAYLVCGDWHLAEDAVSIAFAKLYVNWHRVREVQHLDAYARTAVLRSVIDERRRPWRRERAQGDWTMVVDRPGPDAADGVHDRMVLLDALRALPRGRRAVLVLRYYEGLSVEETAEALGCSVGNVKSQTARGLAALRDAFPAGYSTAHGGQS